MTEYGWLLMKKLARRLTLRCRLAGLASHGAVTTVSSAGLATGRMPLRKRRVKKSAH